MFYDGVQIEVKWLNVLLLHLLSLLRHEKPANRIHGAISYNPSSTIIEYHSFKLFISRLKAESHPPPTPRPHTQTHTNTHVVSLHKYLPVAVNEFEIFVEIKKSVISIISVNVYVTLTGSILPLTQDLWTNFNLAPSVAEPD